MAVTKAKKAEQIEKLNQDLQKASSMIVGTFSKLTVSKDLSCARRCARQEASTKWSRTRWPSGLQKARR